MARRAPLLGLRGPHREPASGGPLILSSHSIQQNSGGVGGEDPEWQLASEEVAEGWAKTALFIIKARTIPSDA